MTRSGLTERVVKDSLLSFSFEDPGTIPPPVLQFDLVGIFLKNEISLFFSLIFVFFNKVTFGYSPSHILYERLDFGVDLDSRIALVRFVH